MALAGLGVGMELLCQQRGSAQITYSPKYFVGPLPMEYFMESIRKGQLGELLFVTACVEAGICVSKPINDNNRYDYIIEFEGNLLRIQVKSSTGNDDCVKFEFATRSYKKGEGNNRTKVNHYGDEIDAFACVDLNRREVYLVPRSECSNITLRHKLNNYCKNGLLAQDYIFPRAPTGKEA